MEKNYRILTVEDEQLTRELIQEYLSNHGFLVCAAVDGREMSQRLADTPIDLIVMDLNLPGDSGLDLARRLRASSDIPIIMLTGQTDAFDRVIGLELGADDYMTKPFSPRELVARIRAVLRRLKAATPSPPLPSEETSFRFADWVLDVHQRRVRSASGQSIKLTNSEYNLLLAFLRAPQRTLTRNQLLESSRVHSDEVYDRSIDTQILRLRRKLETDPREPELIKTERGAGYLFGVSVTAA